MITQSIKLNLVPGVVWPRINVKQFDSGSRDLQFIIYNGKERFTLTNAMSAGIECTKSDTTTCSYNATVNVSDNVVIAGLLSQMTSAAGEARCELVLTKSGERIGTLNFILDVVPAAVDSNTIMSDS